MDIYAHDEDEEEEKKVTEKGNGLDGKEPSEESGTSSSAAETPPSLVHVGRTSILPQQYLLSEKSQGKIVLTVFSPELLSIGTVTCTLLTRSCNFCVQACKACWLTT